MGLVPELLLLAGVIESNGYEPDPIYTASEKGKRYFER